MDKLHSVQRFDLGKITKIEKTPQGFLRVPGFATRTGVFSYRDANGKVRRELRHPDDVFAPESLATLKNAPVTLQHPPVMLTPENVNDYIKGYTTDRVEVNRDLVETDLIIADEEAIKAVEDGMREISSGYLADLEEESGVYNGAEYDYRQKNIKYNHVALVDRGRAGPEVRLRLDSADAVMEEVVETPRAEFTAEGENDKQDSEASKSREVVVSGRTVKMPEWVADIWDDMTDRYDQVRGQILKMEESQMADMEKKDVDVSQKNISPQVSVVQKAPDGRGSSGKVGPSATNGALKAKGLDEDEHGVVGGAKPIERKAGAAALKDEEAEKKKEDDEEEKKEAKKDYEGAGAVGGAVSPMQQLKDEMGAMQASHSAQMDAMQAKVDEMASASLGQGEHKLDRMDSKEIQTLIRARAKLERSAEKLLSAETVSKFDSMSDDEIRAAVIQARHPSAELKGKSTVYLESRFDSIIESLEGSETVRRKMGSHLLSEKMDGVESSDPLAKRREMIENTRNLWKSNLSASKK